MKLDTKRFIKQMKTYERRILHCIDYDLPVLKAPITTIIRLYFLPKLGYQNLSLAVYLPGMLVETRQSMVDYCL